jgi:hypothetical protein
MIVIRILKSLQAQSDQSREQLMQSTQHLMSFVRQLYAVSDSVQDAPIVDRLSGEKYLRNFGMRRSPRLEKEKQGNHIFSLLKQTRSPCI